MNGSINSSYAVIVRVRVVLTNTIHLTLKMTSAQVVETSATNNCSHPDDHNIRTTDTPGFKPSAMEVLITSSKGGLCTLLSFTLSINYPLQTLAFPKLVDFYICK